MGRQRLYHEEHVVESENKLILRFFDKTLEFLSAKAITTVKFLDSKPCLPYQKTLLLIDDNQYLLVFEKHKCSILALLLHMKSNNITISIKLNNSNVG